MAGYFMNLTILATLGLFGAGGFLVYDSVSHAGVSQFPEVVGGAVLLAVGLVLLFTAAKEMVRWMRAVWAAHHKTW